MTPYPNYPALEAAVKALVARGTIPWNGPLYRNVCPKFSAPAELLSGEGSFKYGGRWNAPGLDRVVFGATHYRGSFVEWESHAIRGGRPVNPEDCNRDTRAFQVELYNVLDLTGATALPSLGIDPARLLDIPWEYEMGMDREPITQAVGRALYTLGIEGILVPCAPEPALSNMVIFRANLDPRSRIYPIP